MPYTLLLSNMGYARDLGGSFLHHTAYAYRHFRSPIAAQKKSLHGLKTIIAQYQPDICCLLEIDSGSVNNRYYNQMHALIDADYNFFDIENKYAQNSKLRKLSVSQGKSNGFIAKKEFSYTKHYMSIGAKRLIYSIKITDNLTLFFTHFSLQKKTRHQQFIDLRKLVEQTPGEVIILGDFNIFNGVGETSPLLEGLPMKILSDPTIPTFTFAKFRMCLDLCMASESLAEHCKVQVIPQSYSDHDALLVRIDDR